jgi:glycosyltransferase involved in cell wall biosynthesis
MRILHLINHCQYGNGSVHVAVDLACVQAELGHAVMCASGGGDYLELMDEYGVRCETLVQKQKNPLKLMGSLATLMKICRSFKPDIIHAHMMAGAVFGKFASVVFRIPLVTTVHNSFDTHSFLMRLGDKVVAVSNAERDLLIERGYDSKKVVAVLNGSNRSPRDNHFETMDSSVLESIRKPFITTVCGLHFRKGVHDLIAGFAEIASVHRDWNLYVVGEGPDKGTLIELAKRLNLADRVVFLGYVKNPQPILNKADIFTLASYAEPCGLVVGEAREAGCAIVGTAVGGTPEMLEFGHAGLLVDPKSPKEIAAALDKLMSDPVVLETMRANSKRGSEYYRVARVVDDYLKVYASLTSRADGSRANL